MLRIGDFSKLTGVPAKTIRYYEEEGLLIPAQVDTMTGYRQYNQKNIEQLLKILYLKGLGFKLAEIRDFDDTAVIKKSKELRQKLKQIRKSLSDLSNLYKDEKGELFTFWTKGHIFFKDCPLNYEFADDKLIIEFKFDGEVEFYAVYKNIDHKAYKKEEVMTKDDISMPFENDENLIGVWRVCGFVQEIRDFKGEIKGDEQEEFGYYKDVAIMDNGKLLFTLADGGVLKDNIRWTKDYIILEVQEVAQKYIIKEINGDKYLFMEQKSGDYSYGGMKPC